MNTVSSEQQSTDAFQLVPVEPTRAMCEVGASVPLKNNQSEEEWIGDIYRAMIATFRKQEGSK